MPDSSPLAPGYRLDRYELLGPLAEGGMAQVWIARQRGKHGFEKLVAIKTILPQFASDDRFRQMFLDEARIASRIEHFNVARILDLGEEHDILYLVMEYVDGDSLSKLRRACSKSGVTLHPGVLLRILADTCSGLHEAHELRGEDGRPLDIVHRDISPHNVLVSTKGVAKVIDFGIAKARDRMAEETNAGVLKGKIQYMAPEQALGRKVDRRADLWAVGATLHHLLSGKPPFDADNTLGTLHLLTSGRPPTPLPASVHPAIATLVRKSLGNPPESRFQSAAEMRDGIEAAMIEAGVFTTTSDVATFVNAQLAERTAKRRQVIDIALAAAAERQRIEEVLKPQLERTGSGVTNIPRSARTLPGPVGASAMADPSVLGSSMSSATPPSVATPLGTVTSEIIELPRSRKGVVVAVIAGLAALALAGGLVATRKAPRASSAASTVVPVGTQVAGAVPTIPPPPPPSSNIPVISLSDLPQATDPSAHPTVPAWTGHAAVTPPPPPPSRQAGATPVASTAPATTAKPAGKRNVDDGF